MSKKVLYLLGIALTILLGTWLQYSFCCTISSENEIQITESDSSEVSIESKPIKNVSPDYGFHFKTESDSFKTTNNFTFLNSDFNLLLPVSDSINIGIEKLKNSLINCKTKNWVAACYDPRHSILFYNEKDEIFGYIEICFECNRVESTSNLKFISECALSQEELFKEFGITYFND